MFRFASPEYLYWLWIIPVLLCVLAYSIWNTKKVTRKMGDRSLIESMMPQRSVRRYAVKELLLILIATLFVIMLARPQFGVKVDVQKRQGIEAVFVVDVSNSMMAKDISPSRLDRAKMIVSTMIDRMQEDMVGLVIFAGEAFIQLPITSDYVSARMFLNTISPSMIASQGTDLNRAITLASKSFTNRDGIGKAMIIITDGENHDGDAEAAARAVKKEGIDIFVMGIGRTEGTPIPTSNGGYLTDKEGETVLTMLNEDMCRKVASAGGGVYIHIDNSSSAQNMLFKELDGLEKKELENIRYSEYDEQFGIFALLIGLLFIVEVCVLERKNPLWNKIKIFRK